MSGCYKVQHGLPLDTRLAVVARRAGLKRGEALALWISLSDYASQNSPRGSIKNIDSEELALTLEFEPTQVETAIQACRDKGLISVDGHLLNWEKNQKASSGFRTREYRTRQKQREMLPGEDADSEAEISRRRQKLRGETLNRHKKRGKTLVKQF